MTKFFFKFKKPYFWHISQLLGAKKFFQETRLSCTTSNGFLVPCPNSEKSNLRNLISRNLRDIAGGKEGQSLYNRILMATAGGLSFLMATTIAVDQHLEAKHIGYNVCLTKNYCITGNVQKISSIHTFIHTLRV